MMIKSSTDRIAIAKSRYIKFFLACGIIGCSIFIITFLIEGYLRTYYNPARFPVSSLSIGKRGWIQVVNFILSGLLVIIFSYGLKNTPIKKYVWLPRLVGMIGIGLIGAGIFSTDPVYGYPITKPLMLSQFTLTGHMHDLFSLMVFTCMPVVCFKFSGWFRKANRRGWSIYSMFTGIMVIITFILAGAGFKQVPVLVDVAGVSQRLSIISGCLWIIMIAIFMLRNKDFK